jgi:hypothetical protein
MRKVIKLTESDLKKLIGNVISEQSENEYNMEEPKGISLKDRLLFIVNNLDGGHTDDTGVASEQMVQLLKTTIENFVNPKDTIPLKQWERMYYSITNDSYA